MTLNLTIPENINDAKPKISVIGIGGAGGNAINTMINANINNIDFIAANTDGQALSRSLTTRQIQLGKNTTLGLGAGSDSETGRKAAEESIEEIFELVKERLSFLKFSRSSFIKVILCGGGANLNNIREHASSFLNINVRIGRPIGLIDIPEIVHTPTFSCLTGLLIKSLQHDKRLISNNLNLGLSNYFGRIGEWLDKNL